MREEITFHPDMDQFCAARYADQESRIVSDCARELDDLDSGGFVAFSNGFNSLMPPIPKLHTTRIP
jgi:hypothetical protein